MTKVLMLTICINMNVISIININNTNSFIIECLLWARHCATLFIECSFHTASNSLDYFILHTSVIQVGTFIYTHFSNNVLKLRKVK